MTSGEGAGQKLLTDGETRSAIYKVDYDSFTSTSGFAENDEGSPILIKWKKVTP